MESLSFKNKLLYVFNRESLFKVLLAIMSRCKIMVLAILAFIPTAFVVAIITMFVMITHFTYYVLIAWLVSFVILCIISAIITYYIKMLINFYYDRLQYYNSSSTNYLIEC